MVPLHLRVDLLKGGTKSQQSRSCARKPIEGSGALASCAWLARSHCLVLQPLRPQPCSQLFVRSLGRGGWPCRRCSNARQRQAPLPSPVIAFCSSRCRGCFVSWTGRRRAKCVDGSKRPRRRLARGGVLASCIDVRLQTFWPDENSWICAPPYRVRSRSGLTAMDIVCHHQVSGSKLRCPPLLCFGLPLPCNLSSCLTRSCCLHCYRSVPFPACYSSQPSLAAPALGS